METHLGSSNCTKADRRLVPGTQCDPKTADSRANHGLYEHGCRVGLFLARFMKIARTPIDGVVVGENTAFTAKRGMFTRLFCASDLAPIMGSRQIVQVNKSRTV